MRSSLRSLVALALVTAALGAGVPDAAAKSYVPGDEARVQDLVNATRAGLGLTRLASNEQLVAMARGQSDRMADRGSIYHNPDLGGEITRRGLAWLRVGENVGVGPNVLLVHEALLDSPKHYENIVHPAYDAVGIGVTKGDDGRFYVTQVFAELKGAAIPAPSAPAAPVPTKAPPAPAPQPATPAPRPIRPQPALPVASPEPIRTPNALVGGLVNPSPGLERPTAVAAEDEPQAADGFIARAVDVLVFWR